MNIQDFLSMLPDHKASLRLVHNEHLDYHQTVKQSIDNGECGYDEWVSDEEKQKAIETNDCWYAQVYPNTPVGFYTLAAHSLVVLIQNLGKSE